MRVLIWRTKMPCCVKALLQVVQEYGRSSVCVLTWRTRLPRRVKFLLHFVHEYGHCPVCTCTCLARSREWLVNLWQTFYSEGVL